MIHANKNLSNLFHPNRLIRGDILGLWIRNILETRVVVDEKVNISLKRKTNAKILLINLNNHSFLDRKYLITSV
jgi:hypothetical protein